MAGSYCKFCGHRCFVHRVAPGIKTTHWATCRMGADYDRERTGYDYSTAFNLMDPKQAEEYERIVKAEKETTR